MGKTTDDYVWAIRRAYRALEDVLEPEDRPKHAMEVRMENSRLTADVEKYKGMHQLAVMEIERLRSALQNVVDDVNAYERMNNLAPTPGRTECWDSVAHAKVVLARLPDAR